MSNKARMLRSLFIFATIGPAIGDLVIALVFVVSAWPTDVSLIWGIPFVFVMGLSIAFAVGIIPAVAAGAIITYFDIYKGGAHAGFAAIVGLLLGFGLSIPFSPRLYISALLILASTVAALVCWWLTRHLHSGSTEARPA
jgi:hypothetical protein